jgi:hypothetical protein
MPGHTYRSERSYLVSQPVRSLGRMETLADIKHHLGTIDSKVQEVATGRLEGRDAEQRLAYGIHHLVQVLEDLTDHVAQIERRAR